MVAKAPSTASAMQFVYPTLLTITQLNADGFHQELLRGLTHKLNNLLAIIQGFSSLILMNEELDSSVLENMKHIKDASVNISSLSERIRGAGGCSKINVPPLNLSEYLTVVSTAINDPFNKVGVPFDMSLANNLPSAQ